LLAAPPLALLPAGANEAKEPSPSAAITVQAIAAAYRYNDARVDEYLADKVIEVMGTVNGVFRTKPSAKEDKTGTRYVLELSGVQKLDVETRLQCVFDEKARKQLALLEPGQPVTVRGKCIGMRPLAEKAQGPEAEPSLPPARPAYGVVLVDCELVPRPPAAKTEKKEEKKPG
jgi:hypothetical protein